MKGSGEDLQWVAKEGGEGEGGEKEEEERSDRTSELFPH